MKIPSKTTIAQGARVLGDVLKEIDKQVGGQLNTSDDKIADAEVARFLRERGTKSETAGAAVATLQAYMRHMTDGADVPLDQARKILANAQTYLERDRSKDLDTSALKPTWRALALFSEEVKKKGLTAKEIVSDRSRRPIGDIGLIKKGADVMTDVFAKIGERFGGGKMSTDAVTRYLAEAPNTVASAKDCVRTFARYFEKSLQKGAWTQADVSTAMKRALESMQKNASGDNDRSKLAVTWQSLVAFADENAVRNKNATDIVGGKGTATAPKPKTSGLPASLDAFTKLDAEAKAEVLDSYGNLQDHYVTSGDKSLDELTGKQRAFADKMVKELQSIVGDFEEDSGVYGTIGGPEVSVELKMLPNGEIIGGTVSMMQKGFNAEEAPAGEDGDRPYHFDTAAECEAAGVDAGEDISWSANGVFEAKPGGGVVPLGENDDHVSTYWDWSGY